MCLHRDARKLAFQIFAVRFNPRKAKGNCLIMMMIMAQSFWKAPKNGMEKNIIKEFHPIILVLPSFSLVRKRNKFFN